LLVDFINQTDLDQIGDKASVIDAFFTFAQAEQQREAQELISATKPECEAPALYHHSLKREFASENGTELNAVLPKMSPLNPQYLTKKQSVFQKIAAFVEKFKGVGGAERGLTTMLPGEDAVVCGELLAARFGLPFWQVTATATDANRYVLRWARAISGRKTLLVFDGCYHGTVDDVMVRWQDGRTVHRSGLVGQADDLSAHSRAIPFNDLQALESALAQGDVCALLCEPAMTNIGMVLPDKGFLQAACELTRRYGALLVIDETHTISTGIGGCTRLWDLQPDFFVMGKPVAGGVACGVFGLSAPMAEAMRAVQRALRESSHGHRHSGMGTTLSANALAMHCMRVNLQEVMTEMAYAHMLPLAARLASGFRRVIAQHALPWSVTELGARCEFQFCATPPRSGAEAEAAFDDALQMALHLALINRGVLITPFHNMTLCCPATTEADVDTLLANLDAVLGELLALPNARVPC
jgi:glutamate-1-semialdehyde 2,1-aminomutase